MNGKIGYVLVVYIYLYVFFGQLYLNCQVEFLLEKFECQIKKVFSPFVPYFILKINIKSVFVNRTVQDTHV